MLEDEKDPVEPAEPRNRTTSAKTIFGAFLAGALLMIALLYLAY